MDQKNKKIIRQLADRPPVIVVMGHIDHGKSTLLDYIRKANTTEKEAGGITQHVSAYEVEANGRKMTFLDTPGHEAFCSIRARSTKVADIAILVVSAEDGVKPQTLEALSCIKTNSTPFVVALNKIDRAGANIDKAKQDLAENGVLVEGWGGNVPIVPISAKTGEGVPELLEIISLQADLEELKGDPSAPAEGFVIESDLNPKQGISATLIIKNGTLKTGQFIASGNAYAPIRALENYNGENISEASFSSPVRISGWNVQPSVGNQFKIFSKKEEAVDFISKNAGAEAEESTQISGAFLGVVVKSDTLGSLDALEHEFKKIGNEKIAVKIISKGVGTITEKDLKTANIKNNLVIGFNVGIDKGAEALAMRNKTEVKIYEVIYDLIDYIKEKLKENTPTEMVEKMTGSAKILKVFSKNKDKQVVGGRMESGEIKSGGAVKILRREAQIGSGKIKELQAQKIKTDIIKEGQEFGLMIESKIEIAPGDTLVAASMVKE